MPWRQWPAETGASASPRRRSRGEWKPSSRTTARECRPSCARGSSARSAPGASRGRASASTSAAPSPRRPAAPSSSSKRGPARDSACGCRPPREVGNGLLAARECSHVWMSRILRRRYTRSLVTPAAERSEHGRRTRRATVARAALLAAVALGGCDWSHSGGGLSLDRVEPAIAVAGVRAPVLLHGTGFTAVVTDLGKKTAAAAALSVRIGPAQLSNPVLRADGVIEATLPDTLAPGVYEVSVALGARQAFRSAALEVVPPIEVAIGAPTDLAFGEKRPFSLQVTSRAPSDVTLALDSMGVSPAGSATAFGVVLPALVGPQAPVKVFGELTSMNPASAVNAVLAISVRWSLGPLSGTVDGSAGLRLLGLAPAMLSLTASATPAKVSAGLQRVSLALSLSNAGGAAVRLDALPDPTLSATGSAAATVASAPASTAGTLLAGGASATYTWQYDVSGGGALSFSASASGVDANSATALAPGPAAAGPVTVQQPAKFSLSASLNLSTLSAGLQQLQLTLQATNSGGAGIMLAPLPAPSIAVTGTASASAVSSPASPAGTTLASGATQSFVWTYSVAGSGSLAFTASASGTDANAGTAVTAPAAAAGPATVQKPATLTVASVTASPSLAHLGDAIDVAVALRNNGEASATQVSAASVTSAPINITALQVAITFPDSRATLQGGGSLTAVASAWNTSGAAVTQLSLSATGPGSIAAPSSVSGSRPTVGSTFSVSANAGAAVGSTITLVASATDALTGVPVSSAPVTVTIGPPVVLALRCRPQPQLSIAQGQSEEARLETQLSDGTFQDATLAATWSSSATSVATVTAGIVKGVGVGDAVATGIFGGLSATCPVHIGAAPPSYGMIPPDPILLGLGGQLHLRFVQSLPGARPNSNVPGTGTWSTSAAAVATVSSGLVTGVSAGTATITACVVATTNCANTLAVVGAQLDTGSLSYQRYAIGNAQTFTSLTLRAGTVPVLADNTVQLTLNVGSFLLEPGATLVGDGRSAPGADSTITAYGEGGDGAPGGGGGGGGGGLGSDFCGGSNCGGDGTSPGVTPSCGLNSTCGGGNGAVSGLSGGAGAPQVLLGPPLGPPPGGAGGGGGNAGNGGRGGAANSGFSSLGGGSGVLANNPAGGGGGGNASAGSGPGAGGGGGGGAILFRGNPSASIRIDGLVSLEGGGGGMVRSAPNAGPGGAGAGGSFAIDASSGQVTGTGTITVRGGAGGGGSASGTCGGGGGGGGGVVLLNPPVAGPALVTLTEGGPGGAPCGGGGQRGEAGGSGALMRP